MGYCGLASRTFTRSGALGNQKLRLLLGRNRPVTRKRPREPAHQVQFADKPAPGTGVRQSEDRSTCYEHFRMFKPPVELRPGLVLGDQTSARPSSFCITRGRAKAQRNIAAHPISRRELGGTVHRESSAASLREVLAGGSMLAFRLFPRFRPWVRRVALRFPRFSVSLYLDESR